MRSILRGRPPPLNPPLKFSALSIDFSSPSPDPLGLRRPAQAGVKPNYPTKKWLFYRNYMHQFLSCLLVLIKVMGFCLKF